MFSYVLNSLFNVADYDGTKAARSGKSVMSVFQKSSKNGQISAKSIGVNFKKISKMVK